MTYNYGLKPHMLLVCLIFLCSLCFNLWYISWHPFLHDWDEIFHALVAKNLTYDATKPMLYRNPVLPTGIHWNSGTIWLHKQPIFLWQIAASVKLLGNTAFAVRLPSAILLSAIVFPVYDIGRRLSHPAAGIAAAILP